MFIYSIDSPDRSTGIQNPNKLKVVLVVDLWSKRKTTTQQQTLLSKPAELPYTHPLTAYRYPLSPTSDLLFSLQLSPTVYTKYQLPLT